MALDTDHPVPVELLAVAIQPDRHLSEPQWWEVRRPTGHYLCRVPDVTAMSLCSGWLILWRYAIAIGAFPPGTFGPAFATEPPVWHRYG